MLRKQLEEIMNALSGMNLSEWRVIREQIDRSFGMEISEIVFSTQMAEITAGRARIENDQIFRG